jgi:hypothetical protein
MFTVRSHDGAFTGQAKDPEALESLTRNTALAGRTFQLDFPLDIPLTAVVIRRLGEPDTVYLASNGKSVDLTRNTDANPGGDLGVSCAPEGIIAEVRTLNVEFREYEDPQTDRGIVWVVPGEPAVAYLHIRGTAGEIPGLVRDIAEKAVRAVEQKVLKHFVIPTA